MRGVRHPDQSPAARKARNAFACAKYYTNNGSRFAAHNAVYNRTPEYRASKRRYNLTAKGKDACRRNNIKQRCKRYGRLYEEHETPMPADGCCPYCRIEMTGVYPALDTPTLDHTVPITGGGDHVAANTKMICLECNRAKGTRPLSRLLAKLATKMPVVPDRIIG